MKNGMLLLLFPCLMLLFTLAISYIERVYRSRRRRGSLGRMVANARMVYYYLPTVDGHRLDALNPERPLDQLPKTSAAEAIQRTHFTHSAS